MTKNEISTKLDKAVKGVIDVIRELECDVDQEIVSTEENLHYIFASVLSIMCSKTKDLYGAIGVLEAVKQFLILPDEFDEEDIILNEEAEEVL